MPIMPNEKNIGSKNKGGGMWFVVCLAIGVGVGVAVDQLTLGVAIGAALGLIGPLMRR